MKRRWITLGVSITMAAVILAAASGAYAQSSMPRGGENWPRAPLLGRGYCSNLTAEQRQAVQDRLDEMIEGGATRQQVRSALGEMLRGYGVELPDDWENRPRMRASVQRSEFGPRVRAQGDRLRIAPRARAKLAPRSFGRRAPAEYRRWECCTRLSPRSCCRDGRLWAVRRFDCRAVGRMAPRWLVHGPPAR